jgi:hypothetical protein
VPVDIVSEPVSRDHLRRMATAQFGDFVKAVVVDDPAARDRILDVVRRLVVP